MNLRSNSVKPTLVFFLKQLATYADFHVHHLIFVCSQSTFAVYLCPVYFDIYILILSARLFRGRFLFRCFLCVPMFMQFYPPYAVCSEGLIYNCFHFLFSVLCVFWISVHSFSVNYSTATFSRLSFLCLVFSLSHREFRNSRY